MTAASGVLAPDEDRRFALARGPAAAQLRAAAADHHRVGSRRPARVLRPGTSMIATVTVPVERSPGKLHLSTCIPAGRWSKPGWSGVLLGHPELP